MCRQTGRKQYCYNVVMKPNEKKKKKKNTNKKTKKTPKNLTKIDQGNGTLNPGTLKFSTKNA